MTLRSAADDEIALTLASPIGMGEGILDPSYPRPPCGRVPCRHSAVFSNECARITRDLDFKIINLVIFESFVVKNSYARGNDANSIRASTSRRFARALPESARDLSRSL